MLFWTLKKIVDENGFLKTPWNAISVYMVMGNIPYKSAHVENIFLRGFAH